MNCPKSHRNYVVPEELLSVSPFFKSSPASQWNYANFISSKNIKHETRKVNNQLLNIFKTDLEKILKCPSVPLAIRTYANDLMKSKDNLSAEKVIPALNQYTNYGIMIGDNASVTNSTIVERSNKKIKITNNQTEEDESIVDVDDLFEEAESNEGSFISTTTDNSYILLDSAEVEEKMPAKKQYYLSMQEIAPSTNPKKYSIDGDLNFEERIALSAMNYRVQLPKTMPQLMQFSPEFNALLREFNRSIAFDKAMNVSTLPILCANEQNLACMLLFTSNRLKKQAQILPCAISKKYNVEKNNEMNFLVQYVALLFESLIINSKLHLNWDVTPNSYTNCELDVHFNRHDFILHTADGMEIGTGEIKPYQATDALVEEDRCRIAESCKKQLHQRLLVARSKNELQTYGIMVNGTKVQLSTLQLSETGEYNYYIIYDAILPTTRDTYAFMEETLVKLVQFVNLMENSLIKPEEMADELILPEYSPFLKPTVYMINKEETM